MIIIAFYWPEKKTFQFIDIASAFQTLESKSSVSFVGRKQKLPMIRKQTDIATYYKGLTTMGLSMGNRSFYESRMGDIKKNSSKQEDHEDIEKIRKSDNMGIELSVI